MPIANIPSVMTHGILSHERASQMDHISVAMEAIQEKRDKKQIPGGLKLHQYANLYFHARNPMMYKRKEQAPSLCVLRVSTAVLNVGGVVLSDSNASSDYVRFLAPSQWQLLPFEDIYSMDWRHPDPITFFRQRSRKCAEVLVPHRVDPNMIVGAHVLNEGAAKNFLDTGCALPVHIDPVLFFR